VYFAVEMSENRQVIYKTNIDYEASYQKLNDSKVVLADLTKKGLLWVRFFDTKTVFMFSINGTLQVTWHDLKEKQILFSLIKKLLVAREGQELKITPTKQRAWIPYNEPFKLNWCSEEKEYFPTPAKPTIPKHPYVTIDGVEPEVPTRGFWIFKREIDQSSK